MKRIFASMALCAVLLLAQGCSEEAPSLRIRNDYSKKANVQLKPAAGNTININDVAPNTSTAYQDVSETTFTATASVQGENTAPTVTFGTKNDYRYTVVLTNTNPPELKVESEAR